MNRRKLNHHLKNSEGLWPPIEQELLLRAALLDRQQALEAWRQWKSSVDINELDRGSFQLLPILYKQLSNFCIDDPSLNLLKGVYRANWYKNQLLLDHAAIPLQILNSAGIKIFLLKEAALVVHYYQDIGLRSVSDFEFFIPPEQSAEALKTLIRQGWVKPGETSKQLKSTGLKFSLKRLKPQFHKAGYELKIDHQPSYFGLLENADHDIFGNSVQTQFKGLPVSVLNPTDLLFLICINGVIWKSRLDFQWLIDARTIITKQNSNIDWWRLINQAQERQLILPILDSLSYLQQKLNAPIPDEIIQELKNIPVSEESQNEYSIFTKQVGLTGKVRKKWYQYKYFSQSSKQILEPSPIGFLKYLQSIWSLDQIWLLPVKLIEKGFYYGLGLVSSGLKGRKTSAK